MPTSRRILHPCWETSSTVAISAAEAPGADRLARTKPSYNLANVGVAAPLTLETRPERPQARGPRWQTSPAELVCGPVHGDVITTLRDASAGGNGRGPRNPACSPRGSE